MRRSASVVACAIGFLAAAAARGVHADEPPPKPVAAVAEDLKSADLAARRAAAYAVWQAGDKAKPVLSAVAAALRDDDEYVRTTADKVLATFRFEKSPGALEEAIPELLTGLADRRVEVRRLAAGNLWRAGWPSKPPPPALGPALAKALDDDDAAVRASAAAVAANYTVWVSKETGPALRRRATDSDKDVRTWAVQALGASMAVESIDVLIAALADPEAKVRIAAAGGLGIPSPRARPAVGPLVKALADPEVGVREAAAGAFASIGGEIPLPEAVPPLLAMLDAEETNLRTVAASALGQVGDPRAVEPLSKRLADDTDAGVRAIAAGALGAVGPEAADAMEVLVAALGDSDAMVVSTAASALSSLGPLAASAEEALRRALKHEDGNVRHAVLLALGRIGPPSAETRAAFRAALDDPSPAPRGQAVASVGLQGAEDATAVPALVRLLARPDSEGMRYTILYSLARIGPAAKEAAPAVRAVAATGMDRLGRAYALARISATPEDVAEGVGVLRSAVEVEGPDTTGEPGTAMALLTDLGAAARPARAALALRYVTTESLAWVTAASALVAIDGAKAVAAVERLRTEARAGDPWAIEALASRLPDDPETTAILVGSVKAESPRARQAAIRALGKAKALPDEVVASIRAAKGDFSANVRLAAVLALRSLGKDGR